MLDFFLSHVKHLCFLNYFNINSCKNILLVQNIYGIDFTYITLVG